MVDLFLNFQPYFNIPDISKPYSISSNLTLLSPSTGLLANYLYDKNPSSRKDTICSKLKFKEVNVK